MADGGVVTGERIHSGAEGIVSFSRSGNRTRPKLGSAGRTCESTDNRFRYSGAQLKPPDWTEIEAIRSRRSLSIYVRGSLGGRVAEIVPRRVLYCCGA